VVFVRDVAVLDGDAEALGEYAGNPPPDSFLIVRAPVLDQRRKLHKILASAGRVLEFPAVDPFDRGRLTDAVRAMAEERGLRLDRATCELLAELAGGELIRLAGELDKIRAWLGPGENRVTLDVVREVAAGSGLLSGWEVADAVLRRDRATALAAVRRLVEAGDEPIRIVGGLAWRARVMLQAKALLDAGRRADEVVRSTRAWYYKDELLEGLSRYSIEELRGFPAALLDADRMLKSRSLAPGAVLEQLVDGLLGRAGESR
jgi:DNA polymerase-3 subunit delta